MTKNKRRIIITISARPDYYYLDSYRTDYEYRDYIPTKKKKKAKKLFVLLAVEFEWRPILLRGGPRQFLSEWVAASSRREWEVAPPPTASCRLCRHFPTTKRLLLPNFPGGNFGPVIQRSFFNWRQHQKRRWAAKKKKGNKNWVVAADVSRTIKRVATFDIVHLFVSEKAIGRGPLEEFRQVDHRRLDLSPRSDDLQPQPPEEIYLCASLIVVHHCNGSAHSSVDLPFSWKRKTKTMSATIYMHEQANKFLWAGVARDGGEMQLSHRDN